MRDPIVICLVALAGLVIVYVVWEAWYKSQQAKKVTGHPDEFSLPKPPALPGKLRTAADTVSDNLNETLAKIEAEAKAAKQKVIAAHQERERGNGGGPVVKTAADIASAYARVKCLPDSAEKTAALTAIKAAAGPSVVAALDSIPGA